MVLRESQIILKVQWNPCQPNFKPSKDKIDVNWAGYTQAQKTQIQELIQEAKRQKTESVPQVDQSSKRKSMDQSVSGQRQPSKR